MRPILRSTSLLLLGATALLAQERRPLLGTVVAADGRPLAGALVQLAYVPIGGERTLAADRRTSSRSPPPTTS